MEITTSQLYAEFKEIQAAGKNPVHYAWTLQFMADGKVIPVMKVLSISIERAYNNSYADNILVRVVLGAGTFHHDIFPYRTDLKAVLFREPIGEVSNAVDLTQDIEAQVMRATLVSDSSAIMEGNRKQTDSRYNMDITDLLEVEVGLTDLALEQLRMMTVDGIYRNVKTWELARHILTAASAAVTNDQDIAIRGVDVYRPANETVVPTVVLPTGTRLFEVPDYLHNRAAGLYSAGFGFYLQKHHWYFYPTFDLTRYDKSEKGLTLLRLPPDLYFGSERTYRITENQVIAIIGDQVKTSDPSEMLQLNLGNGLRYADAGAIFDGYGKTENNKTVVQRKANNTEYLIEDRAEQINNVQVSPTRITSNAHAQASQMAGRLGMYLSCSWQYSDPGAIWPGMPVRYMYMQGDQVYERKGVVQSVQHSIYLDKAGITSKRHLSSTSMLLFLGKATLIED